MSGISKAEIIAFQDSWGGSIVEIGKLFTEKGNYGQAARKLVDKYYGYQEGTVLFKPTRAQEHQFRSDIKGALSYFIGGDKDFKEDSGFALQPWKEVRFENHDYVLDAEYAVCMGNYFFTDLNNASKKVEYTMGIFRTNDGSLKMNLHHSSLPFSNSQ